MRNHRPAALTKFRIVETEHMVAAGEYVVVDADWR
jgi:hypothetical protein